MKHSSKQLCVVGTDTNVGKTYVTGLIAAARLEASMIVTQKWLQTGTSDGDNDIHTHDQIIASVLDDASLNIYQSAIKPFQKERLPQHFKFPGSPVLSSKLENKSVDIQAIQTAWQSLCAPRRASGSASGCTSGHDVLVEGSGGVMVPLNPDILFIDLLEQTNMGVVLVIGNKLGCINHTILTVEALLKRNIPIHAVVLNDGVDQNHESLASKKAQRVILDGNEAELLAYLENVLPVAQAAKNSSIELARGGLATTNNEASPTKNSLSASEKSGLGGTNDVLEPEKNELATTSWFCRLVYEDDALLHAQKAKPSNIKRIQPLVQAMFD